MPYVTQQTHSHQTNQPGKISNTRYVLFYSEAHGMV